MNLSRAGASLLLALGLTTLTACGPQQFQVEAQVVGKEIREAHWATETSCNGDPVLLICQDQRVKRGPTHLVYLAYTGPKGAERKCRMLVEAGEYEAAVKGRGVTVWGGDGRRCSLVEWGAEPPRDEPANLGPAGPGEV